MRYEPVSPEMFKELATLAMASEHWRWLPGARRAHPEQGWAWRFHPCGWMAEDVYSERAKDTNAAFAFDEALPDLQDDATKGCVLALLREAWDDECICLEAKARSNGGHVWKLSPGRWNTSSLRKKFVFVRKYSSEGQALVEGLLAAPKKVKT